MKSTAFVRILVCSALVASLAGCVPGSPTAGGAPPSSNGGPQSEAASEPPLETTIAPEPSDTATPTPSALVPTWEQTAAEVGTGVARISTTLCAGASATGTGFLVAENFIVTAAHVVRGATALAVLVNGQVTSASVVGRDDQQDVALIKTGGPIDGHMFRFSNVDPTMGVDVAAFGYPWGQPIGMTKGTISGAGRHFNTEFGDRGHLLQTDASVNPGNSGGPLTALDGTVVGVVSAKYEPGSGKIAENMGYAVAASAVQPQIDAWLESSSVLKPAKCSDQYEDGSGSFPMINNSDAPEANDVAQMLYAHGQAINRRAYEAAFADFTAETKGQFGGADAWSEGMKSSYWSQLTLQEINSGAGVVTASIVQQTSQSAEHGVNGQTCSDWSMVYDVIFSDGKWLISRVVSTDPGGVPASCS